MAGLRAVVEDCDKTIGAQLRDAEQHSAELAGRIQSGDDVISRIARIVETARGGLDPAGPVAAPLTAPSVAPRRRRRPAPPDPANGANPRRRTGRRRGVRPGARHRASTARPPMRDGPAA